MWFGLYLIFSPLYAILSIIPILSWLGKFVIGVVALIITIPFSLIVISLSWIVHRPIYAITLMIFNIVWISILVVTYIIQE
jgi:hypothetical protein